MDIERDSKYSRKSNPFNNRMEYESHRSSLRSLDRLSDRVHSLNNKSILINAMDIERRSSSNDELYDKLVADNKRFSEKARNSHNSQQHYSYLNRKSNLKILHECTCDDICNENHCICYFSSEQICVIGLCCSKCIKQKNQFLKLTKGYLNKQQRKIKFEKKQKLNQIKEKHKKNMHYFKQIHSNEPGMENLIFCTCKKSHCKKKYCLCFEKGIKCGDYCVCQQCQNVSRDQDDESKSEKQRRWERYATYQPYNQIQESKPIDMNIQQFFDEEMNSEPLFNDTMEFELVNFDNALANMFM